MFHHLPKLNSNYIYIVRVYFINIYDIAGSCWAFSTVVAVEGLNFIKKKKLVSLSEQELVDCDTDQNQGCNGGLMEIAFDFIKKKGGLTSEKIYPYTAKDGKCDTKKVKKNTQSIFLLKFHDIFTLILMRHHSVTTTGKLPGGIHRRTRKRSDKQRRRAVESRR